MQRAVRDQLLSVLILALILGLIGSKDWAASSLLGGMVVVLPNAWFAFRLNAAAKANQANAAGFLVGEFLKVTATLILLVTVAVAYRELTWLSFLAGMFVALKVNLLSGFLIRY